MQSTIERRVMSSVGVIYAGRSLVSGTALKLYVCAASVWGLAQLVWVHRVWENLARVGWEGSASFALSAVASTDIFVQCTLLVLLAATFSLIRDLARMQPLALRM